MSAHYSLLFDTLDWQETEVSHSTPSSPSTIPDPARITRVRTERKFKPTPSGPTFIGQGIAEYILVYSPIAQDEETGVLTTSASYTGVLYLEGTFLPKGVDGEKIEGGLVLSVREGEFVREARAKYEVIGGSIRGDLSLEVNGGQGSYVSKGMVDSTAELHLDFSRDAGRKANGVLPLVAHDCCGGTH